MTSGAELPPQTDCVGSLKGLNGAAAVTGLLRSYEALRTQANNAQQHPKGLQETTHGALDLNLTNLKSKL